MKINYRYTTANQQRRKVVFQTAFLKCITHAKCNMYQVCLSDLVLLQQYGPTIMLFTRNSKTKTLAFGDINVSMWAVSGHWQVAHSSGSLPDNLIEHSLSMVLRLRQHNMGYTADW